ncbi:putative peroxidase [Helianthus anomalus]
MIVPKWPDQSVAHVKVPHPTQAKGKGSKPVTVPKWPDQSVAFNRVESGCDASILLDQTSTIDSEKNAGPNANSTRGFEVNDKIKDEVDKVCSRPVVSCARDSVVADQGLDEEDLVVLSGAYTLGFAQCRTFTPCIYSDTNIDPAFATHLRTICPQVRGDSTLAPLDPTPTSFDVKYFTDLVSKKGLLNSDQALFNGDETAELVSKYSMNHEEFLEDFAKSMIKMGDIKPLTGNLPIY